MDREQNRDDCDDDHCHHDPDIQSRGEASEPGNIRPNDVQSRRLPRQVQRRCEVRALPCARSTAPCRDCRALLERTGIRRVPRQPSRRCVPRGRGPAPHSPVPIRTCHGNATPADRSGLTVALPAMCLLQNLASPSRSCRRGRPRRNLARAVARQRRQPPWPPRRRNRGSRTRPRRSPEPRCHAAGHPRQPAGSARTCRRSTCRRSLERTPPSPT